MLSLIDRFLNSITMYKLVLYCLAFMAAFSVALGSLGLLSFQGWQLFASAIFFTLFCYVINYVFANIFKAPATLESSLITGLILFFIIKPIDSLDELSMVFLISFAAIASKYLLAINRAHIFNPAAFAAVVFSFLGWSATWWVANPYLFFSTLILALLILRKIKRFPLAFSFLGGFLLSYFYFTGFIHIPLQLKEVFVSWPILFFAAIMLAEPSTLISGAKRKMVYGFIIGLFLGHPFGIFNILYVTPEFALIIGNVVSFCFRLRGKITMQFEDKKLLNKDSYEFIFRPERVFLFKAGQYMEWTMPHQYQDSRGIRRYFTLSSAPGEALVKIGVRLGQNISTFKQNLLKLKKGDVLYGASLDGDFVLPPESKSIVFIAGGIGITPFISMIRDLINKKENTDITLFYFREDRDFAYADYLTEAQKSINLKIIFEAKLLNQEMIKKYVPNITTAHFYLSGPNAMVESYKALLRTMGISLSQIKTDYFPGY